MPRSKKNGDANLVESVPAADEIIENTTDTPTMPAPAVQAAEGSDGASSKAGKTSRKEVMKAKQQEEAKRISRREETETFLTGWSALSTSMKRKTILKGTVAGIEVVSTANTSKEELGRMVCLSVILDGRYKVLIPFEEVYRSNPIDMSTVDLSTREGRDSYIHRQKQMAEKMHGAEIPFIVTHMANDDLDDINGNYLVSGSRKKALKIIEERNYRPDRDGNTAITEGSFVEGVITAVSRYSVSMNVGGIDVQVPVYNLTFVFVRDLNDHYSVGQKVNVQVTKITENPDGSFNIAVDAKAGELASARARQKLLPIGSSVLGIITQVKPSKKYPGKIIMTAYLPHYKMPARISAMPPTALGRLPMSGDEVRLTVKGFSESGLVNTVCRGFHGSPSYLNH